MWLDFGSDDDSINPTVDAVHYEAGDQLIEMDTTSIRVGSQTIVNQVIRGADVMGIHFSNLTSGNASACVCDVWDSNIPGFVEEAGALGDQVLSAFNGYLTPLIDAMTRANGLDADQAQAWTVSTIGGQGLDPTFGGALASAIVNDANNAAIATWLDAPRGTSQVDLLLAMQGQSSGNVGLALGQMMSDANNDAIKTWLAPDGTSYLGQDDYGKDLYKGSNGNVGGIGDIGRDTRDYNNNGRTDDYDVY